MGKVFLFGMLRLIGYLVFLWVVVILALALSSCSHQGWTEGETDWKLPEVKDERVD